MEHERFRSSTYLSDHTRKCSQTVIFVCDKINYQVTYEIGMAPSCRNTLQIKCQNICFSMETKMEHWMTTEKYGVLKQILPNNP